MLRGNSQYCGLLMAQGVIRDYNLAANINEEEKPNCYLSHQVLIGDQNTTHTHTHTTKKKKNITPPMDPSVPSLGKVPQAVKKGWAGDSTYRKLR